MNTPSKEALEAAEKTQDYLGFPRRATNDLAAIIDRHIEPLRRQVAELTKDNAELQKQEAESRRLFYAEQDKRQSAEFRCEELAGALHSAVNELERQTTYRLQKAADAVDAGEPAKQEACGGRCGDPDCNLSTEGELMREPAKHPDSERLEFAFAHDMIVNRRMQSWVKTREQFDAQRGDWEAAARKP